MSSGRAVPDPRDGTYREAEGQLCEGWDLSWLWGVPDPLRPGLSSPPSSSHTERTVPTLGCCLARLCKRALGNFLSGAVLTHQPEASQERDHVSPLDPGLPTDCSSFLEFSGTGAGVRGCPSPRPGLSLTLLRKLPLSSLGLAPGKGAHGLTAGPTFTKFQCACDSYK